MPTPAGFKAPKRRTRVIAVGNQKGGVGKTTNCVNLAAALGEMGRQCLILDLDMNAGTTKQFKIPSRSFEGTFEVMLGEENPLDVVITNEDLDEGAGVLPANVHLIPARRDLEQIDQALAAKNKFAAPQDVLLEPVRKLRGHYDYVFLDTAPNATAPTLAAYKAADYFLLSAMPSPLAVAGLQDAMQDIVSARQHGNPNLTLIGVILSCVTERTNIARSLQEYVHQTFAEAPEFSREYGTIISRAVVIEEAQEVGKTVLQLAPEHKVAHQFRALAHELEERLAAADAAHGSVPAAATPGAANG
jgi:chromosome partitioning protein